MLWLIALLALGVISLCLWRKLLEEKRQTLDLETQLISLQREKKVVFDFLHDLGEAFTEEIDEHQLLIIILNCVEKVTEARSGAIYLWNEDQTILSLEALSGLFPPPLLISDAVADAIADNPAGLENVLRREPLTRETDSLLVQTAWEGVPIWAENALKDSRFPKFSTPSLQTQTYIAAPLIYRGEKLGVMALANRLDGSAFRSTDFEVVKSVADQAAYSLHNAQVYSQLAEKKKMDHDLQTAREIQRILLPSESPKIDGFEVFATNIPAQHVSGDYYDFITVDNQRYGFVVADVSGKGIPASLIMAMCRSVLRSHSRGVASPAQVLREVNRQLYPDIREDMFITLLYLILDTTSSTLTVARAGHEAPLLCRNDFQTVEPLASPGLALGIDNGSVFDEVIKDVTVVLEPHDTVLVYTDGINEARDEKGEEFGKDQLKDALKTAGPRGVGFLVKDIVERVQRFRGEQAQNDDITLAAIQRKL